MTAGSCGPQQRSARQSGSATALLLVDFINALDFDRGEALRRPAEEAARRTAELKRTLKARDVPAVYANDNFGRWRSNFPQLVEICGAPESRGRELVRLLKPEHDDLSVLKPRHSAFYGTPLEFLLAELDVRRLVIVGLVTEMCVLFTAHDAYLRKFELWVPEDCVASADAADHERTIEHLHGVLGADTRPSTDVTASDAAGPARSTSKDLNAENAEHADKTR